MKPIIKKRLFVSSVCICSVLTLACGFLVAYKLTDKPLANESTLTVNGSTEKTLSVSIDGLAPGNETTYTINISGRKSDSFSISVDFREKEDCGSLPKWLTLYIEGGNYRDSMPLLSAFSMQEPISLGKGIEKITLTYKMGDETGNEAQDAYANFEILISAER